MIVIFVYFYRAFYAGVSSITVTIPPKQCCTFRGGLAKLDIRSGATAANVVATAERPYGEGTPPIDPQRRLVYIGTENF